MSEPKVIRVKGYYVAPHVVRPSMSRKGVFKSGHHAKGYWVAPYIYTQQPKPTSSEGGRST